MITVVTGGSKCGRSRYAEELLKTAENKIYIASMQPYGQEALDAIKRHRKQREGKGFATIEQYTDLQLTPVCKCDGILLECIANLTANEMFCDAPAPDVPEKIIRGIIHLSHFAEHLVVVTSQVGADGIQYPHETMKYIENMGRINAMLFELADNAAECVYGIPIIIKGDGAQC